jgi:cytochrome P450
MKLTTDPAELADLARWSAGPPHQLFEPIRAERPVARVPSEWGTQDSGGYWAVLSHEHVGIVARDPQTYYSARGASFLGHALGRLEGRVLLEELLGRDERLSLAGTPERSGGVFINGLKALPVEVQS